MEKESRFCIIYVPHHASKIKAEGKLQEVLARWNKGDYHELVAEFRDDHCLILKPRGKERMRKPIEDHEYI